MGVEAMIHAIDRALYEGSLVIGADEAAKGRGTAFAFWSKADMLKERRRLVKIAGAAKIRPIASFRQQQQEGRA